MQGLKSFVMVMACCVAVVSAQGQGRGRLPLNAGELMPAVSGYDAEGNPFALNELTGHYSVIVFGCLT
ncbi:MAG: hypothetical protein P8L18_05555 [Verrucomicrobiota bacterium]|jgi:hypothetical protein|nr:hypothetical protein [Verrucomicrobiota bacterium]